MKKIDNSIKHSPPQRFGDCHRACHAMILGLEPEEVPHFYLDGDGDLGRERIREFLAGLGLSEAHTAYPGDTPVSAILEMTAAAMPGVPFILGGTSWTGCGHSVVCIDGEIFHDPAGTGIVGPLNGFYWVTVLAALPDFTRIRR